MAKKIARSVVLIGSLALALPPAPSFAQALQPASVKVDSSATQFTTEQLDALLAPIALYPDPLLTQLLMASTYPLQIVEASRWLAEDANKDLKGDALTKALESQDWDPSVKSLVPFPQVLATLNDNLNWTQQLAYAVANQQAAVLESLQRLRHRAQTAGSLKTTEQQKVSVADNIVTIEPANPNVVYVPTYQPAQVYGGWPYPATPPVYFPPSPYFYPRGYVFGPGIGFATGIAITGGLWGWASFGWRAGNLTLNVNRFNTINVNRTTIENNVWRAPAARGIDGREHVQVSGRAVDRPRIPGAGEQHPGGDRGSEGHERPDGGRGRDGGQRPDGGERHAEGSGVRPGDRPGERPGEWRGERPGERPGEWRGERPGERGERWDGGRFAGEPRGGAFGGMGEGHRAGQYGERGAQSRGFQHSSFNRGGGYRGGGGGHPRGGGGGHGRR